MFYFNGTDVAPRAHITRKKTASRHGDSGGVYAARVNRTSVERAENVAKDHVDQR